MQKPRERARTFFKIFEYCVRGHHMSLVRQCFAIVKASKTFTEYESLARSGQMPHRALKQLEIDVGQTPFIPINLDQSIKDRRKLR